VGLKTSTLITQKERDPPCAVKKNEMFTPNMPTRRKKSEDGEKRAGRGTRSRLQQNGNAGKGIKITHLLPPEKKGSREAQEAENGKSVKSTMPGASVKTEGAKNVRGNQRQKTRGDENKGLLAG